MKFIDTEDHTLGVHSLNETIKKLLKDKHPQAREVVEESLLPELADEPNPVVFEEIDASKVERAARNLHGAGGPTLVDADGWRRLLCSKAYGNASVNLCQAVADLAKKMCTEKIHPDSLSEYVACRLIPLNKGDDKRGWSY